MIPMVIETSGRGERAYDIYSLLLKERIVFVGTPINAQIANLIVAQLLYLNREDDEKEIQMFINSPGGEIYAGLAIYDTMQQITAPISSSASPKRFMGVCRNMSEIRSFERILRFCSAGKNPGARALTRILYGAHSLARNCVRLLTPALEMLYVKTRESGGPEETDEILIILPPCF